MADGCLLQTQKVKSWLLYSHPGFAVNSMRQDRLSAVQSCHWDCIWHKSTKFPCPLFLQDKVHTPTPGILGPSQPVPAFLSLVFPSAQNYPTGRCSCTSVPLLIMQCLPGASVQALYPFETHFKCPFNHRFIQQMSIDYLMHATVCCSGHWYKY